MRYVELDGKFKSSMMHLKEELKRKHNIMNFNTKCQHIT